MVTKIFDSCFSFWDVKSISRDLGVTIVGFKTIESHIGGIFSKSYEKTRYIVQGYTANIDLLVKFCDGAYK